MEQPRAITYDEVEAVLSTDDLAAQYDAYLVAGRDPELACFVVAGRGSGLFAFLAQYLATARDVPVPPDTGALALVVEQDQVEAWLDAAMVVDFAEEFAGFRAHGAVPAMLVVHDDEHHDRVFARGAQRTARALN